MIRNSMAPYSVGIRSKCSLIPEYWNVPSSKKFTVRKTYPELLEIIEHYHGERYEAALNQIEDLGVVRESDTRSDALKALVMDAMEEFRAGQKPIIIAPVHRDGKDFADSHSRKNER